MARGHKVIVGLGETGLSYARFLAARGEQFDVLEDRAREVQLAALAEIDDAASVQPVSADRLPLQSRHRAGIGAAMVERYEHGVLRTQLRRRVQLLQRFGSRFLAYRS